MSKWHFCYLLRHFKVLKLLKLVLVVWLIHTWHYSFLVFLDRILSQSFPNPRLYTQPPRYMHNVDKNSKINVKNNQFTVSYFFFIITFGSSNGTKDVISSKSPNAEWDVLILITKTFVIDNFVMQAVIYYIYLYNKTRHSYICSL